MKKNPFSCIILFSIACTIFTSHKALAETESWSTAKKVAAGGASVTIASTLGAILALTSNSHNNKKIELLSMIQEQIWKTHYGSNWYKTKAAIKHAKKLRLGYFLEELIANRDNEEASIIYALNNYANKSNHFFGAKSLKIKLEKLSKIKQRMWDALFENEVWFLSNQAKEVAEKLMKPELLKEIVLNLEDEKKLQKNRLALQVATGLTIGTGILGAATTSLAMIIDKHGAEKIFLVPCALFVFLAAMAAYG
jgi:hypothetical protein